MQPSQFLCACTGLMVHSVADSLRGGHDAEVWACRSWFDIRGLLDAPYLVVCIVNEGGDAVFALLTSVLCAQVSGV